MYATVLLLLRLARPEAGDSWKGDRPAVREALRLKNEAESKIEEWLRAAEAGQIGPREYNRFTRRWNDQRVRAESVLAQLASEAEHASGLDAKTVETWPELKPHQRRVAFQAVFAKIVIEPQAGNRQLLRGMDIVSSSRLRDMCPDRIGYEHWTPEERRKLGWVDARFGWPENWLDIALSTAWHELGQLPDQARRAR
ncbi:hypothetical protein ACFWA5_32930 [Streptomyces mirabilis]|uniref:hypothetical protein n=1 Tax=Streptomyces mirabilis TaxID=68239 RepID=UPI003663084B